MCRLFDARNGLLLGELQVRLVGAARFLEGSHLLGVEGLCRRQVDGHRVDLLSVDAEFVVQVGAGGDPGLSNVADGVALADACAFLDPAGEAVEVPVGGRIGALVFEHDQVAVTALTAGEIDHPVGDRAHFCPSRGAVIDAFVSASDLQDGVKACVGEARRDARKFEGGAQEGFAHGLAVG